MVGNVGWGEMNKWVDFYARVMGFAQLVSFDDKDISTEYTALMSKVMTNGNGKLNSQLMNQLKERKITSSILTFMKFTGVQHMLLQQMICRL